MIWLLAMYIHSPGAGLAVAARLVPAVSKSTSDCTSSTQDVPPVATSFSVWQWYLFPKWQWAERPILVIFPHSTFCRSAMNSFEIPKWWLKQQAKPPKRSTCSPAFCWVLQEWTTFACAFTLVLAVGRWLSSRCRSGANHPSTSAIL